MASLSKYHRQNSFISGVNGSLLDGELDRVGFSLDSLINNLLLIQRDDGELKDGIVKAHALHPEAFQKFVDANKAACEPLINQAQAYVDHAASHAERAAQYASQVEDLVASAHAELDGARKYAVDAGKQAKVAECHERSAYIYSENAHSWYQKTRTESTQAKALVGKASRASEAAFYNAGKAEEAAESATERAKQACECRRKAEEAAATALNANQNISELENLLSKAKTVQLDLEKLASGVGDDKQQVEQIKTELNKKLKEAENALDSAVQQVYGGGFSVTSSPSKVPIANNEGKLDSSWFGFDINTLLHKVTSMTKQLENHYLNEAYWRLKTLNHAVYGELLLYKRTGLTV